jgi:hypothetical protein
MEIPAFGRKVLPPSSRINCPSRDSNPVCGGVVTSLSDFLEGVKG